MPINEENGQTVFDPSKRVRIAIGEEFANTVEENAFARLNKVAQESKAVRNTVENYDDSEIRGDQFMFRKNSKTGKVEKETIENATKVVEQAPERSATMLVTCRNEFCYKQFDSIGYSKDESCMLNLAGNRRLETKGRRVVDTALTVAENSLSTFADMTVANDFKNHKGEVNNGSVAALYAASAGINFFKEFVNSSSEEYLKYLGNDVLAYTPAELKEIKKIKFNEDLKYSARNTILTSIVPSVAACCANKFLPENIKHNEIVKFGIETNPLRLVGSGLNVMFAKKHAEKACDTSVSNDENAYKEFAKVTFAKMSYLNSKSDMVGNASCAFGSVIGVLLGRKINKTHKNFTNVVAATIKTESAAKTSVAKPTSTK